MRGEHPDPLRAAQLAVAAGADGITAHLREDRRHIRDSDIGGLAAWLDSVGKPLNFEMAMTGEMLDLAVRVRPHAVCLVPERREERTTEGGLEVAGALAAVTTAVRRLRDDGGARVSLFVAADPAQVAAAAAAGAQVVELHTGAYCDALREGGPETGRELDRLSAAAAQAHGLGLEVHAGHGIDFDSVGPVAAILQIVELNIGHFLIGEAIFTGLEGAIARMRALMDAARS